MWKICDVQPFLLLTAVLDLRLLFRKPFYIVRPYLLSLLDVGIALQGLIAQVNIKSDTLFLAGLGHPPAKLV